MQKIQKLSPSDVSSNIKRKISKLDDPEKRYTAGEVGTNP